MNKYQIMVINPVNTGNTYIINEIYQADRFDVFNGSIVIYKEDEQIMAFPAQYTMIFKKN